MLKIHRIDRAYPVYYRDREGKIKVEERKIKLLIEEDGYEEAIVDTDDHSYYIEEQIKLKNEKGGVTNGKDEIACNRGTGRRISC